MDKQTLGKGLLVSAAIVVFVLVVIAVVIAEDKLGSRRLAEWHYAASWVNGVLAFYAWTVFCIGLKLLLTTRDRFAHILILVVMTVGIVLFAWSAFEEVAN